MFISEMLALPYRKYIYKFDGSDYFINSKPVILKTPHTLRDSSEASHGDTGVGIWDAAVFLAEFIQDTPSMVVGKNILELGCGLGLCGITAALCGASKVTLSDLGYILDTTRENVHLNCSDCETSVVELDWFHPEAAIALKWSEFDIIIASDVLWIKPLIEPLVNTLVHASQNRRGDLEIFISNQQRSERVFQKFIDLASPHFSISHIARDGNLDIYRLA